MKNNAYCISLIFYVIFFLSLINTNLFQDQVTLSNVLEDFEDSIVHPYNHCFVLKINPAKHISWFFTSAAKKLALSMIVISNY